MAPQPAPSQTSRRLHLALEALVAIEWPQEQFIARATQDPDELDRVCRDSRDEAERKGVPFTEADERRVVVQWRKYHAMTEHRSFFLQLCGRCYDYVVRLSDAGALDSLATLAGLVATPRNLGPSPRINYQPLWPTRSSADSFYPDAPGGNLMLGARLIWWCAAAHDSIRTSVANGSSTESSSVADDGKYFADGEEFDYGPGFFRQLACQPFWMRIHEDDACSFNQDALELIAQSATKVFDVAAQDSAEAPSPMPNGRGRGRRVWRDGKCALFRTKEWELVEMLDFDGKLGANRDKIRETLWSGSDPHNSNLTSYESRVRKKLNVELGLELEIRPPNELFVRPLTEDEQLTLAAKLATSKSAKGQKKATGSKAPKRTNSKSAKRPTR